MPVLKTLAIGFVGMVLFWFLFWSIGASRYYGQRLEKHANVDSLWGVTSLLAS
jgi:hypothetical protein